VIPARKAAKLVSAAVARVLRQLRHMKKATQKRLELVRQTVRALTPQDLKQAQGGCGCPWQSRKTTRDDDLAPQDD
jgi:signal transduction histidine kinase